MGVIVKEALANGRLTARNTDPAFAGKRNILEEEAARLQTTPDALALAAVLSQPWTDVVLSGAATVQQLRSNVETLHIRWDREAAERLAAIAETPDEYWGRRSRLSWN
jgi:aryl-alcohol dehydrogenase-like predicted oxidoreductase